MQQSLKTEQVVGGPDFKKVLLPGYPIIKDSPGHEGDFKGWGLRDIEFDKSFKIRNFPTYDFFGDGSFYLLDVPGKYVICSEFSPS